MIYKLIQQVSPELLGKFTSQFGLNADQAGKAVETTKESLQGSVVSEFTKGNVDGLLSVLNKGSGAAGNTVFANMANNLTGDYVKKLGLPDGIAEQMTGFALPFILNKFTGQTGGKVDKADLTKLLGGAAMGSVKDKVGGFLKGFGK
ncbi:hypothetical protein KI659_16450 [Litoribacter alkaliphilus]|uniref:DUF937 domain-containing protein n=1 Tax=Litoribacter ruber TaxID=702568 RepID=A0AAP2CKH6_9BACT|nr:DUF937 domain-containing protein [Litoribacter alkaliphilus]MBS9525610.1 hypothetical protein [Litoribacter alkaliphilus]